MNGTTSSLEQISNLPRLITNDNCQVVICPPATLLTKAKDIVRNSIISIGSQNCHQERFGAYTGEISPHMLVDLGVTSVIIGHSERRENYYETNKLIQKKAKACHELQLQTIICIGETYIQKDSGKTFDVLKKQVDQALPDTTNHENTIIAYEPIWAIGTGKTPSLKDIEQVHKTLRNFIAEIKSHRIASRIRIIYGGSVNLDNCSEILNINDVDGVLVGGASLLASSLSAIINASN